MWHTQGSGKSLTMAFYARQIILHPEMENPTFVVMTDRNDLDDQLFGQFSRCHELLRQQPQQSESRDQLQDLLKVASGGVVFTTIQKFFPEQKGGRCPTLSERRNIVVIADEAHSSQTGQAAAKLKQVFSVEEQEELADGGEISTEDILSAQMAAKVHDFGITY
ncbi:MAG: DEAD/DEAH box helicase family protein, partial [Gemmatimonadetes bacterium]|nr:DEAD/DEAH box helicase family protein [Gemmatimonadota bacterium]